MLDVQKLRQDFPIFQRTMNGKPLVYLDSGATTQKPQQVITAVSNYYQQHNANVNRGVYELAEESTQMYEAARQAVAQFIGAKATEIIFTRNTTESLNLLAYAWGLAHLKTGDEIIVSLMEHHSNIVPWQIIAAQTRAKLLFVGLTEDGELNLGPKPGGLNHLLSKKTKIVSLTHISNVLGTINPLAQIFKKVKRFNPNIICIADGAQSVPHMPVNVASLHADFLAFSGHKICGPMGIGVLWGKEELLETMPPFLGGGDMIKAVYLDKAEYKDLPHKFEAGTPNVAGAVGLKTALEYIQTIGIEAIASHEQELVNYALAQLKKVTEAIVYGPDNRSGLIAFSYKGVHAHDVGQVLANDGIAVRSGQHCTMPLHEHLSCLATTRLSLYIYNSKNDIDQLMTSLEKVKKVFSI
ncbi:cysteine desulfurase [Candidatus Beckwithbacteria bacterium]|nr:cysteine desulfurase [Candidatus Beckwithbacteria bacterium]